jgi:competence protein ComGC
MTRQSKVNNTHREKIAAFTLAEVLITLGIIGVVAALTMPALISNYKKKELETAFKRNYSIIQQAVGKWEFEKGEKLFNMSRDDISAELSSYFNTNCTGYTDCVPNGKVTGLYQSLHGGTAYENFINEGSFRTTDGVNYYTDDGDLNTAQDGYLFITVDINGAFKKPNRWGYDVFMFEVISDGKLLPEGAPGTYLYRTSNPLCSLNLTDSKNGQACAYYALTDKDYWKNLP